MIVTIALVSFGDHLRFRWLPGRELPISPKVATFRNSEFHKYQQRILQDPGFAGFGDYRRQKTSLERTIFLSPRRNLLVELGEEAQLPFFTLETITNQGMPLETHSLISASQETSDPAASHQRRSASHEDLILAMVEHDNLVDEFTDGKDVLEMQVSENCLDSVMAVVSS